MLNPRVAREKSNESRFGAPARLVLNGDLRREIEQHLNDLTEIAARHGIYLVQHSYRWGALRQPPAARQVDGEIRCLSGEKQQWRPGDYEYAQRMARHPVAPTPPIASGIWAQGKSQRRPLDPRPHPREHNRQEGPGDQ